MAPRRALEAVPLAIAADLLRPSLPWLVGGSLARGGLLVRNMSASRDPQGFTRLRTLCEQDASVSAPTTTQVAYRAALLLAAQGGALEQVSSGDVMALFAAEDEVLVNPSGSRTGFYRMMRELGAFGPNAPESLPGMRTQGQRTPEELNARFRRAVRARGHFPNEQSAVKTLYLVVRSLDPEGTGQTRWAMRWKPALNAFAITFSDRMPAAENN